MKGVDYVPMRPRRRRQRSTQWSQSIITSTIGEDEQDDEDSMLKRIVFEIIDKTVTEMIDRSEKNSNILNAVETASGFLKDGFSYQSLLPLRDDLKLELPPEEELRVARNYLNSKSRD